LAPQWWRGNQTCWKAVELLGSLRSHRTGSDQDLIRHGDPAALIRASCGDDQLAT